MDNDPDDMWWYGEQYKAPKVEPTPCTHKLLISWTRYETVFYCSHEGCKYKISLKELFAYNKACINKEN